MRKGDFYQSVLFQACLSQPSLRGGDAWLSVGETFGPSTWPATQLSLKILADDARSEPMVCARRIMPMFG